MTATFFNNLKFTQRILMYLLPFALVLGPFFSDLFAIFVSMIFIILSIKEKKWHYYKHPLIIIFWTWCIYLILLSILSQNPTLYLESSLFHWRFGFLAIAVWYKTQIDSLKKKRENEINKKVSEIDIDDHTKQRIREEIRKEIMQK